jgi:hypothetical protein
MKGRRMPHGRVLKLQNSVSQFMVHGARDQSRECTWIVVDIYLPDILSEPQNTFLIFQRADHRFGCSTEIRQAGNPFGVASFRFMLFGHVDHDDGTVHGEHPSRRLF